MYVCMYVCMFLRCPNTAGQPEQASLNQCQLVAQNWCSAHTQLMVEIRFLCYVFDTRALTAWSFVSSHVTSRCCQIFDSWHQSSSSITIAHKSNCSLATYPFLSLSKLCMYHYYRDVFGRYDNEYGNQRRTL